MLKKSRKNFEKTIQNLIKPPIQNPILRNCSYIIIPIVALMAFYFIRFGTELVFSILAKVGWPITITFVITSLGWNAYYGWREMKNKTTVRKKRKKVVHDEYDEDDEYEEYEEQETEKKNIFANL